MFYKLLNAYTRRFSFPHRGLKYFLAASKWLGLKNRTYIKKLADKFYMQVDPSEHIQQQLFWYGYYEKELGVIIKKTLRADGVFLDIGANIGYFSLLAASRQPTAKIFSFEPVSSVFEALKKNISINNVNNISAIKAAVGNRHEEKEIYISDPDNIGMSSFHEPENYSGVKEKVDVITIDEWVRSVDLQKTDLVKVDVEGNELAALQGMKETLQHFKPLIITEVNPGMLFKFGLNPVDIFLYLKELDFNGFLILKNAELRRSDSYPLEETGNVLFIHDEKLKVYNNLF